jgi:excisionase family DNA binding protein
MTRVLLNAADAAEYLGTTTKHMYRLVHERRIPFVKLGDGAKAPVRFKVADLEAWIDAHRTEAVA